MADKKIKNVVPTNRLVEVARVVIDAIKSLREPNGSSLSSIRKYIQEKHKNKGNAFYNKIPIVIRRGLSFGALQTNGHGQYKLDSVIVLAARKHGRKRRKCLKKKKAKRKRRTSVSD